MGSRLFASNKTATVRSFRPIPSSKQARLTAILSFFILTKRAHFPTITAFVTDFAVKTTTPSKENSKAAYIFHTFVPDFAEAFLQGCTNPVMT